MELITWNTQWCALPDKNISVSDPQSCGVHINKGWGV